MTNTNSLADTIKALFADGTLLVRQEIALAKAEAGEKLEQMQIGIAAIAAGLLLAFTALLVLVQALVVALGNIMPPSVAALLVGVVLAVIAYFSIATGQAHLKPKNLAPRRTIHSVRETADSIKEAA